MNKPPAIATVLFLLAASVVSADSGAALKDAFEGHFFVGAALNASHFAENPAREELVARQFNNCKPNRMLKSTFSRFASGFVSVSVPNHPARRSTPASPAETR
jgi:hypothetical protein